VCHVKNTGRCRELLTENATVFVQESDNPNRKTKYDLIAVMKGDRLINMDSQIPNKVFGEWAVHSGYFGNITLLKAEKTYCNSRFDYYIETDTDKIFVEVKGVTLEGCKYPLKNGRISRRHQWAVSNEIVGNCALIEIRRGGVWVIESMD
jgi:sugar fermentation stimulation protein A